MYVCVCECLSVMHLVVTFVLWDCSFVMFITFP